MPQSMP
jgi:alanyl-tRNA synthetase